jgi:secreted PhoX family phosphatase
VTCRYKCGEACFHDISNGVAGAGAARGETEYFGDIAAAVVSRRTVMHGAAVMAVALTAGSALAACDSNDALPPPTEIPAGTPPGMKFVAVAPNTRDAVVIPDGYQQSVVIRWGDPVLPGAPAFDVRAQSAAAQRQQFGFNNDFAALLPIAGSPGHFLLVVNHEYTTEEFMFFGYDDDNPTRDQFQIAVAAHGLSMVEVQSPSGTSRLTPVMGRYNRRITADTPITITGPAAGRPLLKTTADPSGRSVLGTLNNCSGGVTPWGTTLSAEENFHMYFGAPDGAPPPDAVTADRLKRYGIKIKPSVRKWERFDTRFDVSREPQEVNRFGYVVEVNPFDAASTPVKHTAMGRLKHEAANISVTADGTVVAYSGDDERFEYMYKFVSSKKIQPGTDPAAMAANIAILDEGTLYVGKFSSDTPPTEIDGSGKLPASGSFSGTGTWIPLLRSGPNGQAESLVAGMTPDEVAVFTRFAADKAGATKMDRPEDFAANPLTGLVYAALTNNDERGLPGKPPADTANPRNENRNGQIIEIRDDHAGTSFTWSLLLVCGDPAAANTYYGGFDKSKVSPISCPDNLAFDSHGNLWIATDGNALKSNDGLFAVALTGANRGETRQFLTVPRGAETCGPVVTDDFVTVSVQHPGEGDGYSLDKPLSHWPDGGESVARPAVVVVWKTDGQIGL